MSGRVAVDGTDVEVAHQVTGTDLILYVMKDKRQVLCVRAIGAMTEMTDLELNSCESATPEIVLAIGRFAWGKRSAESRMYCSFCGKSDQEVRKMLAGPSVFICGECAEVVADIAKIQETGGETVVLPKRREPKASIAMTLMRDVQGSAADKLRMFEKICVAGGFAKENPAELAEAEKMLRAFAATEKGTG